MPARPLQWVDTRLPPVRWTARTRGSSGSHPSATAKYTTLRGSNRSSRGTLAGPSARKPVRKSCPKALPRPSLGANAVTTIRAQIQTTTRTGATLLRAASAVTPSKEAADVGQRRPALSNRHRPRRSKRHRPHPPTRRHQLRPPQQSARRRARTCTARGRSRSLAALASSRPPSSVLPLTRLSTAGARCSRASCRRRCSQARSKCQA